MSLELQADSESSSPVGGDESLCQDSMHLTKDTHHHVIIKCLYMYMNMGCRLCQNPKWMPWSR